MIRSPNYEVLLARIKAGGVVILDGATGTELERRGASMDTAAWCGVATQENVTLLEEVHLDYIHAGSEIITANTYASSRLMLTAAGLGNYVEEINQKAIRAAMSARDQSGRSDVIVAGSLSHMVPIEAGTDVENFGSPPNNNEVRSALNEIAGIIVSEGCDLILLEMMYHLERTEIALEVSGGLKLPVWAGLSARITNDGRLLSYYKGKDINFDTLVGIVVNSDIDAVGIMHTPSNIVSSCLEVIRQHWDGPLYAYPDSGHFRMPNWVFEDVIEPNELKRYARDWVNKGTNAIGGCCGLSVEHISTLSELKR